MIRAPRGKAQLQLSPFNLLKKSGNKTHVFNFILAKAKNPFFP